MNLEKEILTSLVDKYERSKLSKGELKVKRDVKLDITDKVFDNHRNYDVGELEIALKQIENDKFAYIRYDNNGEFQSVVLITDENTLSNIYKFLKRSNPKDRIEDYKNTLQSFETSSELFIKFKTKMLELLDEKRLTTVSQYFSSQDELIDLFKAINTMSMLDEDVPERVFCAKLFFDSKKFNLLRGKISKIIKEFSDEPFDEEEDVIASMGVVKNTSYAFIKGNIKIKLNNQIIDLLDYKFPLALSDLAIKNLDVLDSNAKNIYTVENLTSFENLNDDNSIIIYLGGFHNNIKRQLIKKIYFKYPNINYYHYGDIDAGGFYILNHLREKTGIPFKPYMMDISTLKKYGNYSKCLTSNDKDRLLKMKIDSRFSEFEATISYMLQNNIKLEQETEID